MHCVSCDCFLTDTELMMVKDNGEFEDMCYDCRGIAFNAENIELHEYQHQHLTEMIENYFYVKNIQHNEDIG